MKKCRWWHNWEMLRTIVRNVGCEHVEIKKTFEVYHCTTCHEEMTRAQSYEPLGW